MSTVDDLVLLRQSVNGQQAHTPMDISGEEWTAAQCAAELYPTDGAQYATPRSGKWYALGRMMDVESGLES